MQMRMIKQLLPPGVQYGEEADLCTQVLWIGGDGPQGLGGRAEQDVVDDRLVVIGDRRGRFGMVKTMWKYVVFNSSEQRRSSQAAWAKDWHFGQ